MKPLSPVDAISPAFSRARTILASPGILPGQPAPFRFRFFLKIALVAAFTNIGFYGATISIGLNTVWFALGSSGLIPAHRHSWFAAVPGFTAAMAGVFLFFAFIALALWTVLGWLWCRLRFTLFDLVVYRQGRVSLAWSRYSSQAWRFVGLLILVSLAFLLLLAITAGPLLLHLIATLRHLSPENINSNPAAVLAGILPMYGVFIFAGLAGSLLDAVMQDFVLPPMAIEDAPIEAALGRFFRLAGARFWSVALYLLLRFVLEMGITWVGMMAVFLVLAVCGMGGAGLGFVLYQALWHAGPVGAAVFILYCAVAALLLLACYLLAMVTIYGVVATVKQCYAVYFYGSSYPELGDRLDPPAIAAIPPVLSEPPASPLAPPLPPVHEPPPLW